MRPQTLKYWVVLGPLDLVAQGQFAPSACMDGSTTPKNFIHFVKNSKQLTKNRRGFQNRENFVHFLRVVHRISRDSCIVVHVLTL